MKSLFILLSFSLMGSALADACQAPGQSFLEQKLKESFGTDPAEKELRNIAMDPRNYAVREELKSLNRRAMMANRIDKQLIDTHANEKFSQMIVAARRSDEIMDFPVTGANARLVSASNSLAIEVDNLPKEDLDVLPQKVLDKLSNKVKIHYMYPYDKFEYVLTYDGRELPMDKAFLKIQNDYEDACEDRLRENQHTRDLHGLDRKSRGLQPIQKTSTGAVGSAAQ